MKKSGGRVTIRNHSKIIYSIIVLLIIALALVLFGVSFLPFDMVKARVDLYEYEDKADLLFNEAFFQKIVINLRIAGGILLLGAGGLYISRRKIQDYISNILSSLLSFAKELKQDFNEEIRKEDRVHLYALFTILLLAVAVRLFFLFNTPMRWDETVTFVDYASKPLWFGLSNYSRPNNHIFHTFLVHVSYLLFGNHPWAIRLPAFVAGILLVPASYMTIRIFYNKYAALLTAAYVASSLILIDYSTNARGYTLICLIFLLLLILANYLRQNKNPGAWTLFVILSALGFYTIPIMLYPVGIIAMWLFLSAIFKDTGLKPSFIVKNLGISLAFILLLTFLLYSPVITTIGLDKIIANKYVTPQPVANFTVERVTHNYSLWAKWTRDIPLPLMIGYIFIIVIGFPASLIFHKRLSPHRIPIAFAIAAACIPILIVHPAAPLPRVWLFMLPLFVGLVFSGITYLLSRYVGIELKTGNYKSSVIYAILAVVLSFSLSLFALQTRSGYHTKAMGEDRDIETITIRLKDNLGPGDKVRDFCSSLGSWGTLGLSKYYFNKYGIPIKYRTWHNLTSLPERILVITNNPRKDFEKLSNEINLWGPDPKYNPPKLIQRYKFVNVYEITKINH